MAYKTILVHVDESPHASRRAMIAAQIAARDDAHLIGLALTGWPEPFYDPLMFHLGDPATDPLLQVPRQRAADALAAFEDCARQFHVGSIETRLEENESVRGVTQQARYCDLVVLGQYDPDDTESSTRADFAEMVILECGVPVLMVPFAGDMADADPGRRVLVCWDAGQTAVRALHAALPMLQRAAHVDVAVFDRQKLPAAYRAVPDKDIVDALARHGIMAKVTRQVSNGDLDIGNGLLSLAADLGSDLLVMGCYGHARFREVLLGGVTRQILKSMTVPVLMAH